MTDEKAEELCSCGYPDGTFACKVRHQFANVGHLKREREAGPDFGLTEER